MKGDWPYGHEDLTREERRFAWACAAIGIAALFAATVGWDALAAFVG